MKQKAEEALRAFKEEYSREYADSPHSQQTEALALGVDTSTAQNYLSIGSERHLPAGLVPHSSFAPTLMEWLASQCGGVFVRIDGKLRDDDREEFSAILNACSKLARSEDPIERQRIFKTIETRAAKASLEITRKAAQ